MRLLAATWICLLTLAAPAAARTLYAAPGGAETGDCSASARCSLDYAVFQAQTGDDVDVAPGDYPLVEAPLNVAAGVTVHGEAGARPQLSSSLDLAITLNSGAVLSHVALTYGGAGTGISATSGRVDDAVVSAGAGTAAVQLDSGSAMRGSIVRTTADATQAVRVVAAATPGASPGSARVAAVTPGLRHDTVLAAGDAVTVDTAAYAAVNSILRGQHRDLTLVNGGSLTTDHCALRSFGQTTAGGDVSADPTLAPDGHEAGGSPTIDAGRADDQDLPTDIDGEPRTQGPATDIGADETANPASPPPATPTATPTATATPTPTPTPLPPRQPVDILETSFVNGVLVVRARDEHRPVSGVIVTLADGTTFAESACSSSRRGVFAPGAVVEFRLPLGAGAKPTDVEVQAGNCATAPEDATAPVATGRALAVSAAACPGARTIPSRANAAKLAAAVLCLVNQVRAAHRLKPLVASPRLVKAARLHSGDMVRHRFYAHQRAGGPSLPKRLRRSGWRGAASGENLGLGSYAFASPAGMLRMWLHSPPHRANILNRRFRAAGIVIAPRDPLGHMRRAGLYTLDFGSRP